MQKRTARKKPRQPGLRANDLSHQISAYRIRIDCIGARRDKESYAAEMLLTLSTNSPLLHRSAS